MDYLSYPKTRSLWLYLPDIFKNTGVINERRFVSGVTTNERLGCYQGGVAVLCECEKEGIDTGELVLALVFLWRLINK